eukprot:SAG31_NODE_2361_length_5869_cov_3.154246_6_plen_138_part_00
MHKTTAFWSVEKLKAWTSTAKRVFDRRAVKSRELWDSIDKHLDYEWPSDTKSAWVASYGADMDAVDVAEILDDAELERERARQASTTSASGVDNEGVAEMLELGDEPVSSSSDGAWGLEEEEEVDKATCDEGSTEAE